MTTTSTKYVPWDPMRICDICGDLQRKSNMRRMPGGLWACPNEPQWRDSVELSKANARQKPFRILPVKDAKPENWSSPDSYEGDDGEILNFIARMVRAGTRYESVISGDLAPLPGNSLQAYGWSAQYLYGLIAENKRPLRMINLAKSSLLTIATALMLRQVGTALAGQTTANFGAFLESGATVYQTQDAASCGLAMLYAYRVFGTKSYLVSARLAASYLRNVQSIGKCGAWFTSSDSAGTARLYTGAVCSEVSTAFGVDPTERFYSNHQFYPQDLLTLKFWNELKTTDGDQTIGTSGIPDGFVTSPAQLLSTSIEEMRVFWLSGVRDSVGETYSGLSTTTPREFFNAYPLSKPHFTIGSGRWEFHDGDASTGTTISSQNFGMALSALFSYEGASSQVTEVSNWMRSFSDNPEFNTPANTSISVLARSVTGIFDATACPTTNLLVRDASNSYAAIAKNATGLYDWGSFGLLSSVWGNLVLSSFTEARKIPLGRNQRFYDGQRSDGDHFDWITLRGQSGLSLQTSFFVDSSGAPVPAEEANTRVTSPPRTGLVFWVKGDVGLESTAGVATAWRDQSGFGQDVTDLPANPGPDVGLDTINGIPCVTFPLPNAAGKGLYRQVGLTDRNGVSFGYGTGQTQARTVVAILKPRFSAAAFSITGGIIAEFGSNPTFQPIFDLEDTAPHGPNGFYLWSNGWRNPGAAGCLAGPDCPGGSSGPYNGQNIFVEWSSTGFNNITVRINGVLTTLTPDVIPGPTALASNSFALGRAISGGLNFFGAIPEMLIFDHALSDGERDTLSSYINGRYAFTPAPLMVNDAVRAAQFGAAFRINPSDPMQV